MSDWLFKSWLKISALTAILFFFSHPLLSQKLGGEYHSCDKDNK